MNINFAEALRDLRTERGLSQQQLAQMLYVDRSTVARWENGSRLPNAEMLFRLSECLQVDFNTLMRLVPTTERQIHVMMVDDEPIVLNGGLPVLEKVMPEAEVKGFTKPSEALEFARQTPVYLAFLDIEMGRHSGLELCRELLQINSRTNVVFLTAYQEYAFNAWDTGACGFLVKPITPEALKKQLTLLRYPLG